MGRTSFSFTASVEVPTSWTMRGINLGSSVQTTVTSMEMSLPSVDLLELLRAALDELDPILAGRIVDIEMPRVRVVVDPVRFRQEFAALIEAAAAGAEAGDPITVRVERTGKAVRIRVVDERGGAPQDGLVGTITATLAPGTGAADA
jgi:signal transduction histidine kinase